MNGKCGWRGMEMRGWNSSDKGWIGLDNIVCPKHVCGGAIGGHERDISAVARSYPLVIGGGKTCVGAGGRGLRDGGFATRARHFSASN